MVYKRQSGQNFVSLQQRTECQAKPTDRCSIASLTNIQLKDIVARRPMSVVMGGLVSSA